MRVPDQNTHKPECDKNENECCEEDRLGLNDFQCGGCEERLEEEERLRVAGVRFELVDGVEDGHFGGGVVVVR